MPDDPPPPDPIQQQAFALVNEHARRTSADTERSLEAFRNRSAAHATALEHAQRLQAMAPNLRYEKDTLWDSIGLWFDIRWARWSERSVAWKLAAAVPLVVICIFATRLLPLKPEPPIPSSAALPAPIEYATRWRETREFTLSDGSSAFLDWQTSITEVFDRDRRRVVVHGGKVAFDVVSDTFRPFIVEAGSVRTEVTGTEFVVQFLTDSDIEVSVMEGRVRVATDAVAPTILKAAETVVARGSRLGVVHSRDREDMGRWRDGLLVYRERALLDVLNELARYTPYTIDGSRLRDIGARVTGVFYKDQAEDALSTILESQGLAYTQVSNRLILEAEPPSFLDSQNF